jgi:hypothetical protein
LLASGLIKPFDLFFNSLFFEKRKAALMEAFKIQALWIPLLCQAQVDSFKLFYFLLKHVSMKVSKIRFFTPFTLET